MIWEVPRMWDEGDVWIIGGGPSLPRQFDVPDEVIRKVLSKSSPPSAYSPYLAPIHNKHVIGINAAFLIGDWIDMVFFGDKAWWLANRERLAEFPGLKVSCHPKFGSAEFITERIKYLARDKQHVKGISSNPCAVSWNSNSGAAAISVAANAGAKRVILLGFDMKLGEDSRQHWHALYGSAERKETEPRKLPFHRHLRCFPEVAKDAKRRGIEILNASPESVIECFRKITVKELL